MERRILETKVVHPEQGEITLFEVVDIVGGVEVCLDERPLFTTRDMAQAWIDQRVEKGR
ncbi:hypothetical protein [Roseovarius sp. THAF8]|uniref:hypothetical protein n=1 Tax=Roseovarius sp. THAF8 TaxID=2587846 RepID=UPI001561C366|nr:hypothetical protein [Roseovarius sp. THAF8]